MFDINLFPLHFAAGHEQPELPGLLAASAPRRAERHRGGDTLACLLVPFDPNTTSDTNAEWFQTLSEAYFSTAGPVTSALRAAVEQLHQRLLGQAVAAAIVVIRNNLLYLVTCGPAHVLLINKTAVQDFSDAASGWRGLGAGRTINLRFFQAELEPGDLLLLAVDPPAAWTPAALTGHRFSAPDALRRRLLALCSTDFKAGILQVKPGNGQIQFIPRKDVQDAPAALSVEAPLPAEPAPIQPSRPAAVASVSPPYPPQEAELTAAQTPPAAQDEQITGRPPARAHARPSRTAGQKKKGLFARLFSRQPAAPAMEATVIPLPSGAEPEPQTGSPDQAAAPAAPVSRPRLVREPRPAKPEGTGEPSILAPEPVHMAREVRKPARKNWLKALAVLIRGTRTVQQSAGRGVSKVIPRVLPVKPSPPAPIPTATMVFIALAVPVVIAAVAVTVYYRQGASEERVAFLQQARIYADQAGKQEDPTLRRNSWEQTLYWVKKAEDYGKDDESQALRQKAQMALDSIDGIVRMSLVPAFSTTLGSQIKITALSATSNDLYLLDSSSGRVLHMNLIGRTYEYDPNFNCGPGPSGGIIIGPLVGMATLPPGSNKDGASIVAVDAAGNLLYCIADKPPLAQTLKRPDNNWGRITGMTLGGGNLYVLDLPNNVVYRYDGSNYIFEGQPRLFFGNVIPNLSDVIDMKIYQDDLYLLRSSGLVTMCTWSAFDFAPTRCTDPAPFGDARQAKAIKKFPGARFLQMATTQPPDPSLYILDAEAPSLYHFSLRLNLQRQLRQDANSDFRLPEKPVTAFTITSTRMVFVAFGNQIFYGPLP